jgi:D-alanyl-D-alanine carboxypeptidase (penicillin-binding protein 5/6)
MTCLVSIECCQNLKIDMDEAEITIGKYEASIGGTSAQIKPGQIYKVRQLLYGLMLPSGNDASLALAVWIGRKLIENGL